MKFVLFALMCCAAAAVQAEIKVGIIGLDTSHAIAFTKIMNVTKDPAVAGFRVTHAYQWGSKDIASATNRYPKYIAQMKEMGVEIVPTIDALIASAVCAWRRAASLRPSRGTDAPSACARGIRSSGISPPRPTASPERSRSRSTSRS